MTLRDREYEQRIAKQIEQYAQTLNMHDLPKAFHVWSNKYIAPAIHDVFGGRNSKDIYANAFREATDRVVGQRRVLSVGCGDGKVEVELAKTLIQQGEEDFKIVGAELSPIQLKRFAEEAQKFGLENYFTLVQCDLNAPAPEMAISGPFDVIIAHHSLHHIVELEKLFDFLFDALKETGIFATCDMIGRNGHMRWPEAATLVRTLWPLLSHEQRYNIPLQRFEEQFIDWDCSKEGFEGIRAQDILPLMVEKFHVRKFVAVGGFVDPFVERVFGRGFDMENEHDRGLITCIARLNDILLDAGVVKPTQMLAHFGKTPCQERFYRTRSSQFCLRVAEPDWVRFYPEAHYRPPSASVGTPGTAAGGLGAQPSIKGEEPERKQRLLKRLRVKLRGYRSRGIAALRRAISDDSPSKSDRR